MIHSHYDAEQILWFVRNYWKYTRDNMIQEFRRTFQDNNFAKSQYQWLKTRYGMKEEWGASLNNPPYSGARPGGPGTEHYEPPDIPSHAPQMIFRTRSDSPTPSLVVAPPPAPVNTGGQAHGANPRNRVSSSGSLRAVLPDNCDYSDGFALSTAQTPTHTAAGTPSFPTSNLASSSTYPVPGQMNSLATNGMNGTYMFGLPPALGSPFVPAAPQMGNFSANTATHTANMANLNASYTIPTADYGTNPSGGVSSFLRTENHSVAGGQQQTNHLTGQLVAGNTDHMLLAMYPFATTQPLQPVGGQYGATFHSLAPSDNMVQQQYALTGLGISNQNHLGQQARQGPLANSSASGMSALTNIGNMMAPTNMNTNAYRSMGSSGHSQYSLPGSHAGSPGSNVHGFMDTIVSPHGPLAPGSSPSKRKRKLIEVECRPPTLNVLVDPSLQAPVGSPGVIAAAQMPSYDGASPTKKQRSAKSSVATNSPATNTMTAPGSANNAATVVRHSPSTKMTKSPKTPAATSALVNSYAGGSHAIMNPDASQSTTLARRVPGAPAMQAQLGSLALAQVIGMPARNAIRATQTPAATGTLVLHNAAAHPQLQTSTSSRTNSFVLPISSRPASRDTISVSSPPSDVVSPNDKGNGTSGTSGTSGHMASWASMQAPTAQNILPQAANYATNAASVNAPIVTSPVAAALAETSSVIQDYSYDYSVLDFSSSGGDLGAMLGQNPDVSTSSFNDDMDRLLFGDGFLGETRLPVDAGAPQSSTTADNPMSPTRDDASESAPITLPMLEKSSSHGSDMPDSNVHEEYSGDLFSSPDPQSPTSAWCES